MRRLMIPVLLIMVLGLTGCLISTQIGERGSFDDPYPDEMEFHFDTPFNKFILSGRTVGLVLLAYWVVSGRRRMGSSASFWAIAVAMLLGCGWLLYSDWPMVFSYRIEILKSQLQLSIPGQPKQVIPWGEIESIRAGEKEWIIKYGLVEKGLTWDTAWEGVTLTLRDGEMHEIDLRPLSVEHRGIIWRMIGRKAQMGVKRYDDRD
ncbi:MAG: hypothetical protein O7A63_01175 [Acidobacteria bacterium]|nr:hypothetical protein [Acidobacteriota bacterium]